MPGSPKGGSKSYRLYFGATNPDSTEHSQSANGTLNTSEPGGADDPSTDF